MKGAMILRKELEMRSKINAASWMKQPAGESRESRWLVVLVKGSCIRWWISDSIVGGGRRINGENI